MYRQVVKGVVKRGVQIHNGGLIARGTATIITRSYSTGISSEVSDVESKIKEQPLISKTTISSTSITFGGKNANIGATPNTTSSSGYSKSIKLTETKSIVLVKIGGGVIENDINALIQSLNFLRKIGLYPIVVHGGGPQLNAELAAAKEPAEYVEGLRVTPASVLKIAQRVFARENLKIVDALEASGTRARPITQGVFVGTPLDPATYGFVGAVTGIQTDALAACIAGDYVPVVSSLAMTEHGQVLNINADVAALELAKAIRPLKIVFVNTTAGMRDGDGKVMQHIVLDQQYDELMKQPWVKHGTKLKIKEFKNCLDALPLSTSITITSPQLLQKELFARNGGGTTVEKGNSILSSEDSQFCYRKLGALMGVQLPPATLKKTLQDRKSKIFVNSSYTTGLIISPNNSHIYNVDKFMVDRNAIIDESADSVVRAAISSQPSLIWSSVIANGNQDQLQWFRKIAQGYNNTQNGGVFWTNINLNEVPSIAKQVNHQDSLASLYQQQQQHNITGFTKEKKARIGLLGARGFTGGHLVRLINQHPSMEMVLAASSTNYGKPITTEFPSIQSDLKFSQVTADNIVKYTVDNGIDGWFMALPDKISSPYVAALDNLDQNQQPVLVDLSSDHRFDNSWVYGSPETNRQVISRSRRIANPGCYATGMFLTLNPLVKAGLLDSVPSCFGISGYSGAGSKPSDKNDTKRLADNIMPYKLVQHTHELEVGHQLKHPIYFMPHVGQFFQGITLTISMKLNRANISKDDLAKLYQQAYANEALVKLDLDNIPEVKANQNKHTLTIGGLTVNGDHVVAVTTLDNLLKGAATQALQNMNLCLGIDELEGIKKEL